MERLVGATLVGVSDLMITPALVTDVAFCISISDESFGADYVNAADLTYAATSPARAFLIARVGRTPVGFATASFCVESSARLALDGATRAELDSAGGAVGMLNVVCVAPSSRRDGIGGALVGAISRWFATRGAHAALAEAWEHPDGACPIGGTLRRAGYRQIVRVADAWRDDSLERGYRCVICGHPCSCAAQIMMLRCR